MRIILKKIEGVRFGLLSPDHIRKFSEARIITADTYDEDGYPIEGGLMDPKLGVVDPGLKCKTCGGRVGDCPGHFGRIELARPVIHVGYAKLVYRLLQATCRKCGRLLLPEKKTEDYREQIKKAKKTGKNESDIVEELFKAAKVAKRCPYCGEEPLEIKFEKPTAFVEDRNRLSSTDVRERLERIKNEDAEVMGFDLDVARPEWMVLTVLPVPPVTVRPSITLESGERSEDDLTHKLVDILRINQRLTENIEAGAPQLIIEDLWELLQDHVTTYFNNEVAGVPPARHRSGRPLKTLTQRLKGKEGRFRSNLSGKRVNFSARTVISPDSNISINEVGVPEIIAKELTVPVRVTPANIEYLKKLVENGPEKYPGANYVERLDGSRVRLGKVKNIEEVLEKVEVGGKVHRHLQNGDVVMFNRQPSLHRMSIMAHEVRVMPYKTFRLNLCVCPPYNADFDGDEMNLHAIQGEEARAEARVLMRVQEQILSPRFGGPIIGGIHDHISGAYLLTRKETKFTKEEAFHILYASGINEPLPEPVVENGREYYTGKQLFSLLLPRDLNLVYRAKICKKHDTCLKEGCLSDAYVVIRNGQLLSGVMDEKSFGAFAGELLDRIVKDYGTDEARIFLDRVTKLAINVITRKGFSTGIDDEDLPNEAKERIAEILDKADENVQKLIKAYEDGILEQLPGRTLEETLEMRIMQTLSEARDLTGSIANEYLEQESEVRGRENSARIMAVSGARGSLLNLTQMAACIGQQAVRGERIVRGYVGRTLPHFKKRDKGARARGFVKSSYKNGLDPLEYFFHSMGGREGLVDTAVRTSQSGYMQRRLINALLDLKVEYDSTVRDTRGVIIEFKHGEDGADPSKTDWGSIVNVKKIIQNIVENKRRS
ncbi:MAG: DNA-directed RNA polymerase subunit A' [Candidatus Hydrothermarchaeota archaeon]|nr:DNA-directed RNA polymerase subunit A' [Candidatus Hydrothermarchaeota archaeon]